MRIASKLFIAAFGALCALPSASALAQTTYTTDAQFDTGVLNSVNHDTPNQLQLDSSSESLPYMYVAQTNEGIVLKIDTRNGKQVARYVTTYLATCPTCTPSQNQWAPSRTTVELNGDLWVANRAFGIQGGVTLIAQDPVRCVDRNGNLQIDTSNDANNDGYINEADPLEFFGQNDECLIKTFAVGGPNAVLRGLAIDADGHLWVGAYNEFRVYEFDTATNTLLRTFNVPSNPYGLAIQGNYVHWASPGQVIGRINQTTGDVQSGGGGDCVNNYGIVVDNAGVIWTGNYNNGLNSHDFTGCPATGFCGTTCTRHDPFGHAHYGITIDGDGQIWASSNYQGWVDKYSSAGVLLGSVATGDTPHGVAIAHDGAPWAAGYNAAVRVEPGLVGAPPVSAVRYDTGVPGAPFARFNYTYSDFTGFLLRNFTQRVGTWTSTTDGGAPGTDWASVSWNNEPQGSTPAGTSITAQCRTADTIAGLALVAYAPVTNGGVLAGVLGRYIQCEFTLRIIDTGSNTSPVLSDVTITPRVQGCEPGPCDDGNSCTDNDTCVAGVCSGTYRWDIYACEFHELVVEMGFEEAGGDTATDSSGHDQHGTISGGATRQAGQAGHGQALCFDGVDDLVTIASHPKLDLWNELTISANVSAASVSGWRSVLLRELNNSDLAYGLYASNATGKPEAVIHNANDQHAASTTALALNTWTHLTATYNGTSVKFYVNGVLKKTKATTGPIGTSTRALYLGGNALWGEFFEGCIDDVRVYHKVLTAAEIAADAATAVTP